MAKLPDNLKDEEEFGGFNSDPNDDTFLLNRDMKYPGDMPDFDKENELQGPKADEPLDTNYQGISKAPMISLSDNPQAESVWDMFDQPDSSNTNDTKETDTPIEKPIELVEEIIPVQTDPESDDIYQSQPDNDELTGQEDLVSDKIEMEKNEDIKLDTLEDGDTDNQATLDSLEKPEDERYFTDKNQSEPEDEPITQDEKYEIAVKELNEPSEESVNESIENIENFEEVSLDEDFKNQLLQDLENSKKKKKKDDQQEVIVKQVSLSEEEPVTEKISFDDFKAEHPSTFGIAGEDKEENDEDSDSRKKPILMYLAYAAAILLLLSGLSIGGYYLVTETDIFTAGNEKEEPPQPPPAKPAKPAIQKKVAARPLARPAKDSVKSVAVNKVEPKKDTVKKVIASTEYKPTKPRWETTDIPVKKPQQKLPQIKKPIEKVVTKIEKTEKVIKPAKITAKDQEYTVEIYSTPSEDDAKMWINKLKSRNVDNIKITEHKLRDKTIYKVRFGKFTTREEAKTEATKLGYPQTWIDRVK
jgi:hypothetical protein